ALALDGVEQRRLLAAYVRARASAHLDVKARAGGRDVVAEEAAFSRLLYRAFHAVPRQRVLAAHIHVAVLAASREARDSHSLDQSERVALHQDAVFEGARLRLVRVAHHVVRARRGAGDRVPLAARWKSRAAPAEQPRVGDLADHRFGPHLNCPSERSVAARGPVAVEAARVGVPDTAQQAHLRAGP